MGSRELVFEKDSLDWVEVNQKLLKMGVTDGLPVIPATSKGVAQ